VEPGRTQACIAIAVAWCGLAVVFFAYAFRYRSVGPLVLALLSVWCLRLAWMAAWQSAEHEEDAERR
jgi:steroid 5-alpha reductase family enzyme